MKKQIEAVQAFADRHSLLLGAVLAALLAGALALYNVSSGPLRTSTTSEDGATVRCLSS